MCVLQDWRSVMTSKERDILKDLKKCNFREIDAYFKRKSEERKAMSKDEKLVSDRYVMEIAL